MEPLTVFIVAFLISFCILKFIRNILNNLPPEPIFRVPFFGHIFLGSRPQESLSQYGPIVSIRMGPLRTVVINDVNLIKEAYSKQAFAGRPEFKIFKDRSNTSYVSGVVWNHGDYQTQHRNFALQQLKVQGSKKKHIRQCVQIEADELMKRLEQKVGKNIRADKIFMNPVGNAIWHIYSGTRFSQDDPTMDKIAEGILRWAHQFNFYVFMPEFISNNKFLSKWLGYDSLVQENRDLAQFLLSKLPKNLSTIKKSNSYVEAFQKKIEEAKDDPNSIFHSSESESIWVLVDLFMAGIETTSTSLVWMILYLSKFSNVRKKLQKEIDTVIGPDKSPSNFERSQLPFAEAVVNESLRYASLLPLGVFRRTLEDTELGGYTIKNNTMIAANLWAVHNNKEIWGDPNNFRPERFLDENGAFKGNENLLPFSIGKRYCLGKTLAIEEMFVMLVTLYQNFEVIVEKVVLEPVSDIVNNPKCHNVVFEKRKFI